MKTIKSFILCMCVICTTYNGIAQDSTAVKLNDEAKVLLLKLEKKLQNIDKEEREKLKQIVAKLNAQQEKDSIYSAEDFEAIKIKNAERIAENIKNRKAIVQNQIDFLKRNGYLADELMVNESETLAENKENETIKLFGLEIEVEPDVKIRRAKKQNRTTRDMFIAFGLNNAIPDGGDLNDSPFKIGGSRFFEIGYQWSTRIVQNNFMRLNYGFSFQFNGLKPEENSYFVDNGSTTDLEPFQIEGMNVNLEKSKFRQDNLIFPVHFQFNTAKRMGKEDKTYFSDKFNFGLGGFLGLNLNNVQKLKYDFNGENEKIKDKSSFNTNNFLYGLSAYAGFRDTTVYMTYNINPIFKDNPVELNNIQLGLRWVF